MADKYATPTGAGAKTGVDWANAFSAAELQTGWDTTVAGETFWHEEGTYNLSAQIDADTNTGSVSAYVNVRVVDAATHSVPANATYNDVSSAFNACLDLNGVDYLFVEGLNFSNALYWGVRCTGNGRYSVWKDCGFISNGAAGFSGANKDDDSAFYQCRFNLNGGNGSENSDASRYTLCEFVGNTTNGAVSGLNCTFNYCHFLENTLDGIETGGGTSVLNSTIADNGADGIDGNGNGTFAYGNCIAFNGGYGINLLYSGAYGNNGFYSNTSGEVNGAGAKDIGLNQTLTSDPFADRAGDDYSFASDGENVGIATKLGGIIGTHTAYMTQGALPPEYSGGGGGGPQVGPFELGAWR